MVAHEAHNLEVTGSIPVSALNLAVYIKIKGLFSFFGPTFIHEFPALEGKIEQFAKALTSTRRTCRTPPDLAEKKNEMKVKAQSSSLKAVCQLFVLVNTRFVCLSKYLI